MRTLWDIGIRSVCWKALPTHGAVGHYRKFPGTIQIEAAEAWEVHHAGHYLKFRVALVERFDQPYEHYRRGAPS